jgi:hypothetical protein
MHPRPLSVTVIAWTLIALGLLGSIGVGFSWYHVDHLPANSPELVAMQGMNSLPIPVQLGLSTVALVITLVSGIFLLQGAGWARWLYLGGSGAQLLLSACTLSAKLMLLPSLVILLVAAAFLFRAPANAYFQSPAPAPWPGTRRIVAVGPLGCAGFFLFLALVMAFFMPGTLHNLYQNAAPGGGLVEPAPGADGSPWPLVLGLGLPLILALIAWAIGSAIDGRREGSRLAGVVLLTVGGFTLFAAFTMVCLLFSSGIADIYRQPNAPDLRQILGHPGLGFACTAVILVAGGLLIRRPRRVVAA